LLAETQELTKKFIDFSPKSRNAHLARLDLILIGIRRDQNTSDDLFSACQNYWDQHKHKIYLFGDFKGILETCDDSLIRQVCGYCMDSVEGNAVSEQYLPSEFKS
jgi:N-terminal acetyltransferase B complex non-catalytic subunit